MTQIAFYEEEDLFKFLPKDYPIGQTPDIKKALLNRTRKRLERWGLKNRLKTFNYYKVNVDSQKLSKLIIEIVEGVYRLFFEPCFILMGPELFMELVNEPDLPYKSAVGSYNCDVNLHYQGIRIYGVEIKVVPFFDGIAIIPKEVLNENRRGN
jgi:hypothetical protein